MQVPDAKKRFYNLASFYLACHLIPVLPLTRCFGKSFRLATNAPVADRIMRMPGCSGEFFAVKGFVTIKPVSGAWVLAGAQMTNSLLMDDYRFDHTVNAESKEIDSMSDSLRICALAAILALAPFAAHATGNSTSFQSDQCAITAGATAGTPCNAAITATTLNGGTFDAVRSDPGGSNNGQAKYPIDVYNSCRYVYNNSSSTSIFVPFRSGPEWLAFIANHPSYTSLVTCSRPTTVTITPDSRCYSPQPASYSYNLPYDPTGTPTTVSYTFTCQPSGCASPTWTETVTVNYAAGTSPDAAYTAGISPNATPIAASGWSVQGSPAYTGTPSTCGCDTATENWTVGGVTCSGTVAATTSGSSTTATETTPNTGSASFLCTGSSWGPPTSATCTASTDCLAATENWNVNGAACMGPIGATGNGSSATATETSPNSGSATFLCTSGSWGPATNAICAALTSGSNLYCWGSNFFGVLGNGGSMFSPSALTPMPTSLPSGVTSFTSASNTGLNACAIANTGAAYCWGSNGAGQLGIGNGASQTLPAQVVFPPGVTSFSSISAGLIATCALDSGGKAYCWGDNGSGELGNGTMTSSTTPVAVTMPAGITFTQISASSYGACALGNNGHAYCWGDGSLGELGNGTSVTSGVLGSTIRTTPVAVTMPAGVTFKSLAQGIGYYNFCALGDNGRPYCWGITFANGGGLSYSYDLVPTAVALPSGVTSFDVLSIGNTLICATANTDNAYCWGVNSAYGSFGNGTTNSGNNGTLVMTQSATPVAVTMPSGVTFSAVSVADDGNSACALGNDGVVYCWGADGSGQLGNGTTGFGPTPAPTPVSMPAGITSFGSLSAGENTNCALTPTAR